MPVARVADIDGRRRRPGPLCPGFVLPVGRTTTRRSHHWGSSPCRRRRRRIAGARQVLHPGKYGQGGVRPVAVHRDCRQRGASCVTHHTRQPASELAEREAHWLPCFSFMASKHVVLIHGSWGRGEMLASARAAFKERGYTAHTPTLRHHELPLDEGAMKIALLSLRDYTDDLVEFVNSLDSQPLLVGHSMGGLLAQLVAARTRPAGLVAACPGAAAGIVGATGTSVRMFLRHLLRPRPWNKPWPPPDVRAISTLFRPHSVRGRRPRDT